MPLYGPFQQQQQQPAPATTVSRKRVVVLVIAVLLTAIFVILGSVLQDWGSTISLILSAMGVVLALVPLLVPLPGSPPLVTPKRRVNKTIKDSEGHERLRKQFEKGCKGADTGALLVYATRHLVSCEILLIHTAREISYSTRVAEWPVDGQMVYAAVFPELPIGMYQVNVYSHPGHYPIHHTSIIIRAETVSVIRMLNKVYNYLTGHG